MADPIHQFEIVNLVPLAKIGSTELYFTNSALFMIVAVGLTALLMLGATAGTWTDAHSTVEGFWYGLAKRSFEIN